VPPLVPVPLVPVPLVPVVPVPLLPLAVVLAALAAVPLVFGVVVAPPQEIKPMPSTSTEAKEARPASERRNARRDFREVRKKEGFFGRRRDIRMTPSPGWERFPGDASEAQKTRTAKSPGARRTRFTREDGVLRMTPNAESATAKSARAAVTSGNSRETVCSQFPFGRGMMETEGGAATFTVSVEVALPAMLTCDGLKLQVVPKGRPPQLKVSGPAKPPAAPSATAKFAELPDAIIALGGEMELTIPPTANCTTCVCVMAPLEALTVME
jgi:hypothetical protein